MLTITRRLASIDLETTGINSEVDSIVQIGIVFLDPDGSEYQWETLVNPLKSIPPSATKVHGISDATVAEAPSFAQVAPILLSCRRL